MPDDQKPLPSELADLVSPPATADLTVESYKPTTPPIKLPIFTFIIGCGDNSEKIAAALTAQDSSLYLESFRQPILDAVHALLDATGFDGLINTPEWDLEIYPGGPTPHDLANDMERDLRSHPFMMENLLANRVLANESFNNYQYVIPDATGFSIYEFLRIVDCKDALVVVGDLKIPQPAGIPLFRAAGSTVDEIIAELRHVLGTL